MRDFIAFLFIICGYVILLVGIINACAGKGKVWWCGPLGFIIIVIGAFFVPENSLATYYLEAEPIAYNTDTTIFSTPNGYYTANAIYDEDTMYLLTMGDMGTNNTEDDEILVVWKCDEGSVG